MFYFKKLLDNIIGFLFPSPDSIRKIEEMSPSEFREKALYSYSFPLRSPSHIHSLFPYKNILVKEAIWQLKYKGNAKIAALLSHLLYEEIIAELEDEDLFSNFKHPLLIPIPISKKRMKKRGYNQMELVGKELDRIDQKRSFEFCPNALVKIKETLPQTLMQDRRLRINNLHGSFEVKEKEKIAGRNIILIDDVFTTGSTIEEAKRALMKARARNVIAFTLAH